LETFQCYLPPATCDDPDEPDDSPSQARALTLSAGSGAHTGSGTLCRGGLDYLSFPVEAGKRAEATVTVSPGEDGQAYGLVLTLLGPGSTEALAESSFGFSSGTKRIGANMTQSGTGYLRISSGSAGETDEWTYTVEVSQTEPLMCETEPGEPNDSVATASNSVLTVGSTTRALCSESDDDHHLFHAAAERRTTFRVDYDSERYIYVQLLKTTGTVIDSRYGFGNAVTLTYNTAAGAEDVVLRIQKDLFDGSAEALIYTVTITDGALPTCDDQLLEPNNSQGQASSMTPGVLEGVVCESTDDDYFTFTLARTSDVDVSVSFEAGTDLDLRLYDEDGVVASSAFTDNPEEVSESSLPAGQYWILVDPYSSSEDLYPIPYTLTLTAPGYCTDDTLDNAPGNDTAGSAVGVRYAVDGPLAYGPTSLHMCRADQDWFSLIALGHERISAMAKGLVGVSLTVFTAGASGPVELGRSHSVLVDGASAEVVSVPVSVTAGLFYLRVAGGAATEGGYQLSIRTEDDPCEGLGSDPEPNDASANAILAAPGNNSGIFCPLDDQDTWKVSANAGTTLTAAISFDATVADVDIELWAAGQASALASNAAEETDSAVTAEVSFTPSSAGTYYVLVKRKPTLDVGQSYTLTMTGASSDSSNSSSAASSSASAASSTSTAGSSSAAASATSSGAGSSASTGATASTSSVASATSSSAASAAATASASASASSSSAASTAATSSALSSSSGVASSTSAATATASSSSTSGM
jgi:hypothetical protein